MCVWTHGVRVWGVSVQVCSQVSAAVQVHSSVQAFVSVDTNA